MNPIRTTWLADAHAALDAAVATAYGWPADVTQALVLTSVHTMSAASSGQPLMRASCVTCVLRGRLTFWGAHSTGVTPTFGSVVTAVGPGVDVPRFEKAWGPYGAIVTARRQRALPLTATEGEGINGY